MKGYIAFCPHFHQPHFQLYKTREEAFFYSYQPWLKLLAESVKLDKFFINIHFSGPFLYWLRDSKGEYVEELRSLLDSGKIGIIGGLADEPFIQLSSRPDDYLYQLKTYDELCRELTGIEAAQWQGIHLVERECGESLLCEITRAAGLLKAPPVYYLDAETFYQVHFSCPGGPADYCLQHFGFKDPFSKTTISHMPEEMLYFALRDEIGGQEFYSLPVHTQYRYQLLKRNSFTQDDHTRIKPKHYLFYIKDALHKAVEYSRRYGREREPVLLIFEDAEKFGQWSKDPQGDSEWLLEFFRLVEQDDELRFTSLRDYIARNGYFDSYPVSCSRSYPEWENWTAHRGIRGVVFGDERLRRVVSRLRMLEDRQANVETAILSSELGKIIAPSSGSWHSMLQRAVLQSTERYEMIKSIMQENYPPEFQQIYTITNRVRNLVYQEDPKWASRHPCYGSSPYYDMQGLAYLEISDRLLYYLQTRLGLATLQPVVQVKDWDMDGLDEVVVCNDGQTVCLDREGACMTYQHVLSPRVNGDYHLMYRLLQHDIGQVKAYNSIYRYSYPLVLTETDSRLQYSLYSQGGRRENCRNSLRCDLIYDDGGKKTGLGDLAAETFQLRDTKIEGESAHAVFSCYKSININPTVTAQIEMEKEFVITPFSVTVIIKATTDQEIYPGHLYLAPQLVSSASPSDEVDFKPVSYLGFNTGSGPVQVKIEDVGETENYNSLPREQMLSVGNCQQIDYVFKIYSGDKSTFANRIRYNIDSGSEIDYLEVKTAVRNYYEGLVFPEQSRLGYNSSGIMIVPYVPFVTGQAGIKIIMTWELDSQVREEDYTQVIKLINN